MILYVKRDNNLFFFLIFNCHPILSFHFASVPFSLSLVSNTFTYRLFSMIMKRRNTRKRLRAFLLHVSDALVATLREVHYKGYTANTS